MNDEMLKEKKISSEEIFNGRLLHVFNDVIELPNGKKSTREYIKHQGAVAVVPVTDSGKTVPLSDRQDNCGNSGRKTR